MKFLNSQLFNVKVGGSEFSSNMVFSDMSNSIKKPPFAI